MAGSSFGWAVIDVVSRPPKSNGPVVERSAGSSSKGRPTSPEVSNRSPSRIADTLLWVLVPPGGPEPNPADASYSGVRTYRFRYQRAPPSSRRMPWTMPSPKNQCGESPVRGLDPFRT